MKKVSQAELDDLLDHADAVSRETWGKLVGHDATAALSVLGSLLAATEKQLGWPRDKVLAHVCDIADTCDQSLN